MDYTSFLAIIQPFLQDLVTVIAKLLLAIIMFIIGYFISVGIGKLITEILKSLKFNKLFEKDGWKKALQRAEIDVDPSAFIGAIIKWVFVVVSLVVAVDVLELAKFSEFLGNVLDYIPRLLVAILVFIVAIIISDIIEKIVRVAVERMRVGYGYVASSIVKWAIWIFTIFLILDQLLPQSLVIQTLYIGIVYGVIGALSLGVGLAIGLGGKDVASETIREIKKKIDQR